MQKLYKLSLTLLFLLIIVNSCLSQYINEKGEVDKVKIISELKQFPDGSPEQWTYADSLILKLARELLNHPVFKKEENGKSNVFQIVRNIQRRSGDYTFMRGEGARKSSKERDSVSAEIIALESQMEALKDSLHTLYEQLIDITRRGDNETRATKEKAALMIGKSPFIEHIKYVFENDSDLYFGKYMDEFGEFIDCWGCQRSGLVGLVNGLSPEEKEIYRWRIIPFLIKYWGRPGEFTLTHYPWEVATFSSLTYNYKNGHLLLEFMRSNAEDPNSPIFDYLSQHFGE